MIIAVDARELAGRPTGVGRYLSELLQQWSDDPDARRHEWRLYAHGQSQTSPPPVVAALRVLPGAGGTRWEQWTLARALARERPDVLFAPGYTAPLTVPCPVALTIHDMSFAAHPEWFSPREGRRRRTITAWSARRARQVITDSRFSQSEIVRHIGVPAAKVRVIHLGAPSPREIAGGGGEREPLILYVGSIFQRRHVQELIDAFITVVAPAVPGSRLEIVGENRTFPARDPAAWLRGYPAGLAARVALRSYVDEPTLADLYRRASVFAFLSEYEGFGLTPLEALAAGAAPAVLDTAIAREIYGPAARYVGDLSPPALGRTLAELLTRAESRGAILRHAMDVLSRYSWPRAAAETLRAIEEAAGV